MMMSPPRKLFLNIIFIMAMTCLDFGQALRVEVNPAVINEMVTDVLSVTCVCDGSDYWIQNVVTLKLGKKGQEPIALYSQGGVSTGAGMKSNIKAEGHIEKDASQSFIKLTIKNPGVEDIGTYVCQMLYVNEASLLVKEVFAEADITIDNENTSAILVYLAKEMSNLKETVQEQENIIQEQNKLLNRQKDNAEKQENATKTTVGALREKVLFLESRLDNTKDIFDQQKTTICNQELKIKDQELKLKNQDVKFVGQEMRFKGLESMLEKQDHSLRDHKKIIGDQVNQLIFQQDKLKEQSALALSRIDELAEKEKNQSQSMMEFINKDRISSAFFTRYTDVGPLSVGTILTFREVVENIGNDFNKDTGIYTAPVDGIYVFHLFALSYKKGSSTYVEIKAGDKTLASCLVEHAADLYDQSSVSAVVHLKAGQQVVCQVSYVNRAGNRLHYSIFTGFAGYLIKTF